MGSRWRGPSGGTKRIEGYFAAGMDGFISKPVSLGILARTLARWIPGLDSPAGPVTAATGAAFDPETLRGLFGEDRGRLRALYESFAEAAGRDIEATRGAESSTELAEAAHRLKGAARMAGARLLAEQAARTEDAARAGDLARARVEADGLEVLLHQASEEASRSFSL